MVSTLKERPNGGFYCSECRMSFGELVETCPFCGSWISNYEELVSRPNLDTIPDKEVREWYGENKETVDSVFDSAAIIAMKEWYKTKVKNNEKNL